MIEIITVQTLVQGLKQLNPSSHSNNLKKYTDYCSNCGPNGLIGCPYTRQQLRFNILLRWRGHGTESSPHIVFQQKTSSLSNLNRLPLSAGEEEDEVVVEVGELAIVLELLPDEGLVGVGGDVRLQEGADLAETLLLRLPQSRRRHRVTGGGGRAGARGEDGGGV
jgi:hypothetical protein